MIEDRDGEMSATLLEALPRETEGMPQFREVVSGTLRRCLEHAGTMTPEAQCKLHIELTDGGRIDTDEIMAHFGHSLDRPVDMKPTDLV